MEFLPLSDTMISPAAAAEQRIYPPGERKIYKTVREITPNDKVQNPKIQRNPKKYLHALNLQAKILIKYLQRQRDWRKYTQNGLARKKLLRNGC